jgi:hypothetical protein
MFLLFITTGDGDVDQVVQHLPNMCETLGLIPKNKTLPPKWNKHKTAQVRKKTDSSG